MCLEGGKDAGKDEKEDLPVMRAESGRVGLLLLLLYGNFPLYIEDDRRRCWSEVEEVVRVEEADVPSSSLSSTIRVWSGRGGRPL